MMHGKTVNPLLVPLRMDAPCQGLRAGDPPCGHPCAHTLFQPLPLQVAPLHGVFLDTVPGKGEYTSKPEIPREKPYGSDMYTTLPWDPRWNTLASPGPPWQGTTVPTTDW